MKAVPVNEEQGGFQEMTGMDSKRFRHNWDEDESSEDETTDNNSGGVEGSTDIGTFFGKNMDSGEPNFGFHFPNTDGAKSESPFIIINSEWSSKELNEKTAWPIWPILREIIKRAGPPLGRWVIREIKKGTIGEKINRQLAKRGWTLEKIKQTLDRPFTTRTSKNKANGNEATVYYNKDGSYVVIDNVTKKIIQISDRTKPWAPDKTIINPYIPK